MIYFVISASKPDIGSGIPYRRSFSAGVVALSFDDAVATFKESHPDSTVHSVNKRGTVDLIFQEAKSGH